MSSGFSGKNGSKIALLSPEVYNRLSIPIFSIALLKPNPEETTPIDPIIEALLAIISSAAQMLILGHCFYLTTPLYDLQSFLIAQEIHLES